MMELFYKMNRLTRMLHRIEQFMHYMSLMEQESVTVNPISYPLQVVKVQRERLPLMS